MKMKASALAAGVLGVAALSAQASPVGILSFADENGATINTSNLDTATKFTIGNLIVFGPRSGAFGSYPGLESFGSITFESSDPTSFTLGDTMFGSFTSDSIRETASSASGLSFYILGDWTPGTIGGGAGPFPASFVISFASNAGTITDSGPFSVPPTGPFSVPPTAIPEVSTWVMMGLGFAGLGFAGYRSSRRSASIVA